MLYYSILRYGRDGSEGEGQGEGRKGEGEGERGKCSLTHT